MRSIPRTVFAVVCRATVVSRARAQLPSVQLPSVQQVYDQYATAVGGRAAWATVTDRAEKGTALIAFAGLTGTYARYYAAPAKMRLIIDLGMGKVEQGSDGTSVWSAQPDGSVSKMTEPDATYAIESNATGAAFLDPARFAKAAVTAKEPFDGVECYKVVITTKAGRERVDYFEVATGLRRGQLVQTPAGEQKTVWRDYKAFENKMLATKQVLTNAQGDIIITVTSVTFTPNDAALFALPAGLAK